MNCGICCLYCCQCSAFFGILFYIIMGILVLAQPQYLRFQMEDNTSSGIACFIVAIIEGVIFVLLIILSGRKNEDVSRENYVAFESERDRPRQSTFKGISMVDMPKMTQQKQQQDLL